MVLLIWQAANLAVTLLAYWGGAAAGLSVVEVAMVGIGSGCGILLVTDSDRLLVDW